MTLIPCGRVDVWTCGRVDVLTCGRARTDRQYPKDYG